MSAAPKFTPGPWRIDDASWTSAEDNVYTREGMYHGIDAGRGYLDPATQTGFTLAGYMSIHDARLIAAAPELHQALRDIEAHHTEQNRLKGRDEARSKTLAIVRAALAKVESP